MNAGQRAFLIILILYIGLYLSHAVFLGKTVYGDGVFYFSWLHSLTVDRDTDFRNEYRAFSAVQPALANGLPGNKYSVGPAVFWAVPYLFTRPVLRGDGFEFAYQLTVGLSGVLYAVAGLVLLYGVLLRFFSRTASLTAILLTAFATNLLFYGSLDTVNSHALSFFTVCAFLYAFVEHGNVPGFLTGVFAGLIFLIRPQDCLTALVTLPYLNARKTVRMASGFIIAALPQLLIWRSLYGSFTISPYLLREGFDFLRPHLLEAAFSPQGGLFLWTPVLLFACYGIAIALKRKSRRWFSLIPVVLLIQLYLISSWSTWWQGASYGSRMFVGMLPLFAVGLAALFADLFKYRFREKALLITFVFPYSALNITSIVYFLLTH